MTDAVPWDSRWREIPNFPGYWISQYGQVFNLKRGPLLSLHYNQHHVLSVRMYAWLTHEGPRGYSRSVPKLVREVWGTELQQRPRESAGAGATVLGGGDGLLGY